MLKTEKKKQIAASRPTAASFRSVITFIYGCSGFVLTLKHRCIGVYPAEKVMGRACHCLTVFWGGECLSVTGLLFSTKRRCNISTRTQCVSD